MFVCVRMECLCVRVDILCMCDAVEWNVCV